MLKEVSVKELSVEVHFPQRSCIFPLQSSLHVVSFFLNMASPGLLFQTKGVQLSPLDLSTWLGANYFVSRESFFLFLFVIRSQAAKETKI